MAKERSLRIRRLEAGFTQRELAELAGTDHSHLSKVELGQRQASTALLRRIDEALAGRALRVAG